jgi:hypothetical protein
MGEKTGTPRLRNEAQAKSQPKRVAIRYFAEN